jgi:hypothetical protein
MVAASAHGRAAASLVTARPDEMVDDDGGTPRARRETT